MRLQQRLAASEMGLTAQVARQQFRAADVSHGSMLSKKGVEEPSEG
jgi:hypothetical protein